MLDAEQPGSLWSRTLGYGAVPPLSFVFQVGSVWLLGKSEFAIRAPSLIASGLALYFVFRIGHRLRGALCGGVAACLLAWHPEVLDEVRIGRCYGLVECLSAALLLVTLQWRDQIDSWQRGVIWAVVASWLIWTHYTAGLLVLVAGGILAMTVIQSTRRGVAIGMLVMASSLVGVACFPLWPSIVRLGEWSPYLNMLAPEPPFWQTVSSFWWLAVPCGGLATAILSRVFHRKETQTATLPTVSSSTRWVLLACSLLPIVLIAVGAVGDLSSLANPRYRVAYAPAGAVWAALILTRSGSWKVSTLALVVTISAAWSLQPLRPWQLGRLGAPADRNWSELSQQINSQSNTGEPILVQSGLVESSLVPAYLSDPVFMEYAACRVGRFSVEAAHPRLAIPFFWDEATQQHYVTLLRSHASPVIWIAGATDTDLNRSSIDGMRHVTSEAGYQLIEEQTWPHAVLIQMSRP